MNIIGNHWLRYVKYKYPITPAKGEPMPRTMEHYEKVLAMDLELIEEQRDEIARLKQELNKAFQKIDKLKRINKV